MTNQQNGQEYAIKIVNGKMFSHNYWTSGIISPISQKKTSGLDIKIDTEENQSACSSRKQQLHESKLGYLNAKLYHEACTLQKLDHLMIPKVHGFYTDGLKASDQSGINSEKPGVHYFVQDYLGENNLWELLDFQAFNETQAKFILRQLISGVEYLHCNNVAHGDIKPENLFLDKDGNLKLNNFDVCSNISEGKSAANKKISTKNYCAPEILNEDYSE